MISRLTRLAGATLAAASIASVAQAAPISKTTSFSTSNHSVTCGVEIHVPSKPASKVLCAALGIPAPRSGFGDPGFVELGLLTKPKLLRLSQDSFVSGTSATLGRGRLWNQLGITCHVGQSTVLCFNGANHGFVIGNGHYISF